MVSYWCNIETIEQRPISIEHYCSIYKNGAVIYWILRNPYNQYIRQKVLPAFYFDLIIPITGCIYVDNHWLRKPFASPVLKESKDVIFEPGASIEGYRFNPLYFSLLTNIQPENLAQSFNPLETIHAQISINSLLADLKMLKCSRESSDNNNVITRKLDERIILHNFSIEMLRQSICLLLSERLDVKDIAKRLGVSPRWIQKLYKKYFNITPRELVQISRFNESLSLIMDKKNISFTSIAHSAHFYDQSHFIKSFRQLSGLLPSQFIKEDHEFYKVMNS